MACVVVVCTPVGYARMFTVLGQYVVKPQVCIHEGIVPSTTLYFRLVHCLQQLRLYNMTVHFCHYILYTPRFIRNGRVKLNGGGGLKDFEKLLSGGSK